MNGYIWIVVSFLIILIVRLIQYKKENWIIFVLIHTVIDGIILLNPIGTILNYFIVKNTGNYLMVGSLIYLLSVVLYLAFKKIFFKKKNYLIGWSFPYIDIVILFICLSSYSVIDRIVYIFGS